MGPMLEEAESPLRGQKREDGQETQILEKLDGWERPGVLHTGGRRKEDSIVRNREGSEMFQSS